jgi:NAD/NADP transhydrogenase alpha subunit
MGAITPLQSPGAIIGVAFFVIAVSGFMFVLAITAAGSGSAPHVPVVATIIGVLGLLSAAWAFVVAGRRRRWLRERADSAQSRFEDK